LPAFLSIVPVKQRPPREEGASLTDVVLQAMGDFALDHPWKIVSVSGLVFAAGLWSASQLVFAHEPISWYPEDDPLRVAFEQVDERLKGTVTLELVVDTGEVNGLYEPVRLNMLDDLAAEIATVETHGIFVGKTLSVVEVSKETHQALNGNDPDFYRVPDTRPLVAQELLLFENSGSDDLEDLVDSEFRMARVTVKVPWADALDLGVFLDLLDPVLHRYEDEYNVTIETNGILALLGRTVDVLIFSLRDSYILALAAITPMMMIMLGSVRRGLVSMIPNLTPIVVTLGVMHFLGIPMDAFTLLIGATALGLAVDDTIHFMHNFGRYYEESQDVRYAVHETLHTTGRAMLFTTVILTSGFFIYTYSDMANLFNFGFLTGIAILMAFFADTILAPALMLIMVRHVYKDTKH
jgi:predicted RND superfamily exporter protein